MSSYQQVNKNLLRWWRTNQRSFPWRNTHELYPILISEIFLHRTKADQVAAIYSTFLQKYPTIEILARTNLDELKKILYSLGLIWRIDRLHKMAIEIVEKYQGNIPVEKEKLMALPGVGEYIASAVRCFSLGSCETLLDTNIVRIIGRVTGIKNTENSRRDKNFKEKYLKLVGTSEPRSVNYALIDLGAIICRAKNPLCSVCPIKKTCFYANKMKNRCLYRQKF